MCGTCGCSNAEGVIILEPGNTNDQARSVHHSKNKDKVISVERDVLKHNEEVAAHNQRHFRADGVMAINLVSSPGSGKTTLLERTISDLGSEIPFFVIEGDQQTSNDANRIAATGVPVVQVNTGKGCHLESDMVHKAYHQLEVKHPGILMIENVGNLVCPSMFNLGEEERVVIVSTTEGEDKPEKYPDIFYGSGICLINKTDLLPYLNFDIEKLRASALKVNPKLEIFEVSATTGEGLESWYTWLRKMYKQQIEHHVPSNSR